MRASEKTRVAEKATRGDLLKPEEVAERLRISPKTVWTMADKNTLPPHRIGSLLMFDSADVEDYIFFSKFQGGGLALSAVDKKQLMSRVEEQMDFLRSYVERFVKESRRRAAPMKH